MLSDEIRAQFSQPVFEPSLISKSSNFKSTVVVTGFAEHLNELIILNAVGHNEGIKSLIAMAQSTIAQGMVTVQSNAGRKNLGKQAWTRFVIEQNEIQNYGIMTVTLINKALLIPGFAPQAYFACDTIEKAVEMVGERIKAALDTSVIPAWYEFLFETGLSSGVLRQLSGQGIRAYRIDTDPTFWQSVISSGLASHALTF